MNIQKEMMDSILELARLCLRFGLVNRVTRHEDGVTFESDTTHTVMLTVLACSVAERLNASRHWCQERGPLDIGLVAQYSVVHDFPEVHCGDTDTIGISAQDAEEKAGRERRALRLLEDALEERLPWLTTTIREYNSLERPEARLVKVLDKALPKLTMILNKGAGLRQRGYDLARLEQVNLAQLKKLGSEGSYGSDQPEAMAVLREAHLMLMRELEGVL